MYNAEIWPICLSPGLLFNNYTYINEMMNNVVHIGALNISGGKGGSVLEIMVGHWTFSDQNYCLSEQFATPSKLLSKQINRQLINISFVQTLCPSILLLISSTGG